MIKHGHKSIMSDNGGAAYVLAITTLLVGVISSLAMLRIGGNALISENTRIRKSAAENLAYAGVEYAYWAVHYNGVKLPYSTDLTFAQGSVHIDVVDDGNRDQSTMLVTSTATSGKNTCKIKRVYLGLLPYEYALCVNKRVDDGDPITNTTYPGGIRTNDFLKLINSSNAITNGVYACTTITVNGYVTPTFSGSPPIKFPDIDYGYYDSVASIVYNSNKTFFWLNHPDGTVIKVNGDVTISGSYEGIITLVATGNIRITGSLYENTGTSYLALITEKDIIVEGSAGFVEAGLYAHKADQTGDIEIKGNSTLKGFAATDETDNTGPFNIIPDAGMNINIMRRMRLPGL